jgi:hypothetical protein
MAKKPKEAGDTVKIPPKLGAFKASKPGQRKKVEAVSVRADVPNIRTSDPDVYAFTSPSTLLNRSAPEKRAHGCDTRLNKKGKPVFTGKRGGIVDSFCKGNEKPCSEARKACPVQLVWREGKPHLRFCRLVGKPGYLVPVDSPEQAHQLSKKACSTWGNWPKDFFPDNAPEIVEAAERYSPKSPWGTPGLGETAEDAAVGSVQSLARAARGSSRPNARQARPLFNFGEASPQPARRAPKRNPSTEGLGSVNPSTWWLVGGTIAGVAVATMLKKSAAVPKA